MKFLIFGFIFVICVTIMSAQVGAVQETTISASPAILDLAVSPGESTIAEITIRNGGEFGLPISVVSKSLSSDEDLFVNKDRKIPDASKWLKIAETEFILSPKEIKKVQVHINTPDDISAGGYYSAISIRGLSLEQDIEQGTSIVIPEISITVLLTVPGDTYSLMEISNGVVPLFATPNTDKTSTFSVLNIGNIHDLVTPEFVINKSGKEVYRQRLSSNIILPNSEKQFTEKLHFPDTYGVYETYVELKYNNGRSIIKSATERMIVTPPIRNIFFTALLTVSSLYIYSHRKNLRATWIALTN